MLEVKNLVKTYKLTDKSKTKEVVALNNVSITFPETGLIFLLGKSGSGKSTLLNAIGGLDTFDKGEIIIKGKSSKSFSQSDFDSYRNTFIGFIFQEYNVLEEFTVAKNLALAIELQGKEATKQKVNELLEMVEMKEFAKRKPNQLSGGQKQRVAIARALIKNPEIIMADEPTGALDSNTGKQVMDTLKQLSKTKLVIIVSHDREFAEIYGDRIIELKDGQIIQDITKKEVEAVKTASGVSVIENELIHIKKGQKLSKEDMEIIFKAINANSVEGDTIISLSERANADMKKANAITDDGNKEVFRNTEKEEVKTKEYDPKKFKLIKSRLKYKDSFKMGASSLKHKKGKLVFTILLSFIAFTIFGVIDTLASFNRPNAVWSTVETLNKPYVIMKKETVWGEGRNAHLPWSGADTKALKELYPDMEFINIYGGDSWYGTPWSSSDLTPIQSNCGLVTNGTVLSTPVVSGVMYMPEHYMTKFNIEVVAGRMPVKKGEVAISKIAFDGFKSLNAEKITEYNDLLKDEYNKIYFSNHNYKIVGIVDDGTDLSQYSSITNEELNGDEKIQKEIATKIMYNLTSMAYISEAEAKTYEGKVQNFSNMYVYKGDSEIYSGGYFDSINYFTAAHKARYEEGLEYFDFYYKGGEVYSNGRFVELNDGEMIVPYCWFESGSNALTQSQLQARIDAETPFKVAATESVWDGGTSQYVRTTIKEYTVVGYYDSDRYSASSPLLSTDDATEYNQEKSSAYDFEVVYDTDKIVSDNWGSATTIKNGYEQVCSVKPLSEWLASSDSWNGSGVSYLKTGKTLYAGAVVELSDDEIIAPISWFDQLGTEEEIKAQIEEGLTIDIRQGDSDNPTSWFTFKVVGCTSGSDAIYVSPKTMTDSIMPKMSGSNMVLAVMSDNKLENEKFIKACENYNDNNIKYTVQNNATVLLDSFGEAISILTTYIVWVGVGFAVFAALLLMNFISTSISYKKREIGILRALGARSSDVFGIFFNESLVIAMINFALATVATFVASAVISNVVITNLGIELVFLSTGVRQILLILGVSLLTAFLSSIIPVNKIAKKKPIDAINNR